QAPFSARLFFLIHQSRHAFYGAMVIVAGLMLFGMYSLVNWSAGKVKMAMDRKNGPMIVVVPAVAPPTDPAAPVPAHYLTYKPEESSKYKFKDDNEKWSNARPILKESKTDNRQRGYYIIPRVSETNGHHFSDKIVGIIYHTPETGIVPFIPANNETTQ